mgnify:CR=1 FL=1
MKRFTNNLITRHVDPESIILWFNSTRVFIVSITTVVLHHLCASVQNHLSDFLSVRQFYPSLLSGKHESNRGMAFAPIDCPQLAAKQVSALVSSAKFDDFFMNIIMLLSQKVVHPVNN